MTTTVRSLVCFAAMLPLACGAVLASGGSTIESGSDQAPQSPEEQAREHYNEGLVNRDHALKLQKKSGDSGIPEAKRAKMQKKMKNAYERALAEFVAAVTIKPDFHQAYSSLGFVYRQTGDYQTALEAYDKALELEPKYGEAIEYRAEAYLGLNRIDEAKASYEKLAGLDPKLADELLYAMHTWIDARRADPGEINVGALDTFERWVDDRGDGKTVSSLRKSRSW